MRGDVVECGKRRVVQTRITADERGQSSGRGGKRGSLPYRRMTVAAAEVVTGIGDLLYFRAANDAETV
jgi:hypothetical protein